MPTPDPTPETQQPSSPPSLQLTGTQVAYYFICHKKLWLFSHGIRLEDEHENVHFGRMLHEDRYQRHKKEIEIDGKLKIDFIQTKDGLEIHEIKKTRKMKDAHRYQLLFYLRYLSRNGVDAVGILNYPLLNQTEQLELTPEVEEELEGICAAIRELVGDKVPTVKRKRICQKCAYLEFCFSIKEGDS